MELIAKYKLISINRKFMHIPADELLDTIARKCNGLEVCFDFHNKREMAYMDQLAKGAAKRGLLFQIHGDSNLEIEDQIKFLDYVASLPKYYSGPTKVTLHPLCDEDYTEAMCKTENYFGKLLERIDHKKITICAENLNSYCGESRIGLYDLINIFGFPKGDGLCFTCDVGHLLWDLKNGIRHAMSYSFLDREKQRRVMWANIHIHDCDDVEDHLPIRKESANYDWLSDAAKLGRVVVFEYNLDACKGKTKREKVDDYLNSIQQISLYDFSQFDKHTLFG